MRMGKTRLINEQKADPKAENRIWEDKNGKQWHKNSVQSIEEKHILPKEKNKLNTPETSWWIQTLGNYKHIRYSEKHKESRDLSKVVSYNGK